MDPETRAAVAAMWDGGDYPTFGAVLAPAAEDVAGAVPRPPRGPVLDVAAGTGSVAYALARAGHDVVATDIAPGLVEQGRRRGEEEGLDVEWHVLAMDELAVLGRRFAAVTSSFGLIFAADPVGVLRAARAVIRPDGVLVASTWHPDGYIASMSRRMSTMLPAPGRAAATAWIRWGDVEQVTTWCTEAGFARVDVEHRRLPWRFPSAEAATDLLFGSSPGHVAAARAVGDDAPALRALVLDHLVATAGVTDPATDAIDFGVPYLLIRAHPSPDPQAGHRAGTGQA
ncbi:MAG: class I SAM-dependent methyltransferase [Dermatophilaceae bacterium]